MELFELKANVRKSSGKGPAGQLRREEIIPAVLYGPGAETVSLSIDYSEFEIAIKQSRTKQILVNLNVQGSDQPTSAMVKDQQVHPLTRRIQHIDFYKVSADQRIKVKVPVKTIGQCVGVSMGGLLQIIRRELEISCLPLEIPVEITIDTTDLDIGGSVHVNEIPLEGDMEIIADVNFTVVTVLAPKTAEEEEEGEEVEGEEGDAEGEEGETPAAEEGD